MSHAALSPTGMLGISREDPTTTCGINARGRVKSEE